MSQDTNTAITFVKIDYSDAVRFVLPVAKKLAKESSTIGDLIRLIEDRVNSEIPDASSICALTTDDGYALAKSDLVSDVLSNGGRISALTVPRFYQAQQKLIKEEWHVV